MDISLIAALMFLCMFALLAVGLPVAFCLGATGVIFALAFSPRSLPVLASGFFGTPYVEIILTLPMFVLMGNLIRYSGIAEAAYDMAYKLIGGLGGGLAMGTTVICTLFAAITGIIPPATMTMGMIAVPSMLKHGYDKLMAVGSVAAGGALADLIPPSGGMIFYALLAKESVGKLFMGGVMPGLLLATLYMVYIGIRCKLQPHLGPPIPPEEKVPWGERILSIYAIWPFLVLIFLVLGIIYMGVATPPEAACFGAAGACLINAIYRKLTRQVLKDALSTTVDLSVMGLWILIGAYFFVNIFSALGCRELVATAVTGIPGGKWAAIAMMLGIVLILGCVMDDWAIITLVTPLYTPIVVALGFSKLWFGIILIMTIQTAFLTPPFGWVLFCLKSVLPKEITMGDVYRSVIPFVLLQLVGLTLVIIFPQIGLWLPGTMK
ncbi:MAG TPA: TRAP transporter large permease subunit [Dehalococcoidales bacterium]|nr:TRAP transporter large permease subunit [Dehalococcoidales bacterium]